MVVRHHELERPLIDRHGNSLSSRRCVHHVSFEDRRDLLGHRSGRITTHYSQAELTSLI